MFDYRALLEIQLSVDFLRVVQLFRYSAKLHKQRGKCSKTTNARGAREIAFAIFFFHTNHLLNVSLKRETDNISIIIGHMTTNKRAIAVDTCVYTTARCWYTTSKPLFPRMFTNPGLLLTKVAVYDKPNLTRHLQVVSNFGRLHSTTGCLCRRLT